MTNAQLEAVYAALPQMLPNFSPDERSEAFTTLLELDNQEPIRANLVDSLVLAAKDARRREYHVARNEIPVDPSYVKLQESMRQREHENAELSQGEMPDFDDKVLAERLNYTLERLDEESAKAFILVELRGLTPEEAASRMWQTPEVVSTRHAGVTGLLRAILSR